MEQSIYGELELLSGIFDPGYRPARLVVSFDERLRRQQEKIRDRCERMARQEKP